MSSVINTISTDLSSEVARLETLLEKAKTTIVAQAQTIAGHVAAAVASNTAVSSATATLKAKLDDFEKVLSGNNVVTAAAVAAVTVPLTINTANVAAPTVNVAAVAPAPLAAQTVVTVTPAAPVAPAANAVITALDAAVHAGSNGMATMHNLAELEAAFEKLQTQMGQSNAAVAATVTPAHVSAIVNAAQTVTLPYRIETDVENAAAGVKAEAEKVAGEVKTVAEEVVEGKVTIGPLHI